MSVTDHFMWQDYNFRLLVASFGASAVLLYGVPESKLSQPRNLIGVSCVCQQLPSASHMPRTCLRDTHARDPTPGSSLFNCEQQLHPCAEMFASVSLLAGGQVVSAVVGVCVRLALDKVQWLSNAVGMSLALLAMQLTQTTHPPGGATALIACSMTQLPPW